MQRLRYRLIMLILTAATIGPALLGLMAGMTTTIRVRQPAHTNTQAADEQSAQLISSEFRPPCSVPGNDC